MERTLNWELDFNPALLLTCCGTPGKALSLSGPYAPPKGVRSDHPPRTGGSRLLTRGWAGTAAAQTGDQVPKTLSQEVLGFLTGV